MAEHTIILETRLTDERRPVKATLASNKGVWGCGKTAEEALGDMVWAHAETFGVQLPGNPTQESLGHRVLNWPHEFNAQIEDRRR